jgi:hypothetical protein
MYHHIRIEPCHVMTHIDFLHEAGLPQDAQGVIDGIPRNRRMLAFYRPIQIIGRRMAGGFSQSRIDGHALSSQTESVPTKACVNLLRVQSHIIFS